MSKQIVDGDPLKAISEKKTEEVVTAAGVLQDFLKEYFIDDDCRADACFGCMSCNAVDLDRRLSALLGTLPI